MTMQRWRIAQLAATGEFILAHPSRAPLILRHNGEIETLRPHPSTPTARGNEGKIRWRHA